MNCDGLFLAFETHRHLNTQPDPGDVHEHIDDCEECREDGDLDNLREILEDPDIEYNQVADYWELFGHDLELDKFRDHVASDETFHTLDDFAIWYNEANRNEELDAYAELAMKLGLHTRIDPRDIDTITWSQDFYLGSNGYVFHSNA